VAEAFLVRNDTLLNSDVGELAGTCSPKLAIHFEAPAQQSQRGR
jgi:hypothetical protein